MNFDKYFVQNVMKILNINFAMDVAEAESIRSLVGSREEFLAWLLLRKEVAIRNPALGAALAEVASLTCVGFVTERQERGYPIFEKKDRIALEGAMKALMMASEASKEASSEVNNIIGSLAVREGKEFPVRHILGLASPERAES